MPKLQEVMESTDAITSTLETFLNARCPVSVKPPKNKETFNSYLLEIDGDQILIDQLIPKTGDQLLIPDSTLDLSIHHNGTNYRCRSVYINQSVDDSGYPFHILALPSKIHYVDKRSSYRLKLKLSTNTAIQLSTADNHYQAVLEDLSSKGARIRLRENSPPLEVNDQIDCEIYLKGFEPFICQAIIRQCQPHTRTGETQAGIEFFKLSSQLTKQLHKVLMKLQRQAIRSDLTL